MHLFAEIMKTMIILKYTSFLKYDDIKIDEVTKIIDNEYLRIGIYNGYNHTNNNLSIYESVTYFKENDVDLCFLFVKTSSDELREKFSDFSMIFGDYIFIDESKIKNKFSDMQLTITNDKKIGFSIREDGYMFQIY